MSKLEVVPLSLRLANDFVEVFHRHNGRTQRNGGKFAIGACYENELIGIAIVGNPLSATFMDGFTAEVTRTCVNDKAPKNTNSFLYGAAWRIWRAMGGRRLVTYTLKSESGASLRGAGWKVVGEVKPRKEGDGWGKSDHLGPRKWQPIYGEPKFRWEAA